MNPSLFEYPRECPWPDEPTGQMEKRTAMSQQQHHHWSKWVPECRKLKNNCRQPRVGLGSNRRVAKRIRVSCWVLLWHKKNRFVGEPDLQHGSGCCSLQHGSGCCRWWWSIAPHNSTAGPNARLSSPVCCLLWLGRPSLSFVGSLWWTLVERRFHWRPCFP